MLLHAFISEKNEGNGCVAASGKILEASAKLATSAASAACISPPALRSNRQSGFISSLNHSQRSDGRGGGKKQQQRTCILSLAFFGKQKKLFQDHHL